MIATTTFATSTGGYLAVDNLGNVAVSDGTTPATGGRIIYEHSYWANLNDFTVTEIRLRS